MKIAIVGAGKLGINLAETLISGEHSITVIDKNESLVNRLKNTLDISAVVGNGKELELLRDLNIDSFDFLIATTGTDEKNMVIASFAKKLGVSKVIARVRDPEYMYQHNFIKESMDIDYITNPDFSIAQEITTYLIEKYTLMGGTYYSGKIGLIEFSVSTIPVLDGLSIKNAKELINNIKVVAMNKNGKIIFPSEDTVLTVDDIIYGIGNKNVIEDLSKLVHDEKHIVDIHKVMIAGGGKTAMYLAKMLASEGVSVKVIEHDKQRCQYLSTHLNNVLILNGDATDLDLLEEENFSNMDAFITVTGYDEENLLLALMGKKVGIEDVVSKISRDSYADIIENMGVDMALNPIDISSGYIQRFIQGSRIVSSQIIQGQAEMLEIIVEDDMTIIGKSVEKLNLPSHMIIAAIQRWPHVYMSDSNIKIEDGDRIFIISLLKGNADVEKLLLRKRGFFN